MKQMKLLKLTLHNFKGVRDFTLDTDGENASIYGENATGKTSIADAFQYLLFGKDSQGKSDFEIKTLNESNEPIHYLDHSTEGVFDIDGKVLILKKVYKEKWTRKRGAATNEFTGHTTDYFVDGVPVKKKEYTETVESIVSEDIFKLLTSPSYFNEQLHWQDRRKALLEVCGDVSDQEVVTSNKGLEKLMDVLKGRSIDDHKKVIAAKRKEINQELERIPIRIDEVNRSIPDTSDLDEKGLKNKTHYLKSRVEEKEKEANRIQNGHEVQARENDLRKIEGELLDLKNNHAKANSEKVGAKRKTLYPVQEQVDSLEYELVKKRKAIEHNKEAIESKTEEAARLRTEWVEANERTFGYNGQTECPACGQALPSDQVEGAQQKALEHFNREKSEKLESITTRGKALTKEIDDLKAYNVSLQNEISAFEQQVEKKQKELSAIQVEIDRLQADATDIEEDPSYQQKQQEAAEIHEEIRQLRESVDDSLTEVREQISGLKSEIMVHEGNLMKFDQVKRSKDRIVELEAQEKSLAAEFERLEEELFLTEEFIRAKVNLLEEKINSKFRYARFKLFDQQINGGLTETCVTTFRGVPYDGGLNNAARINVGLDIIQTLSEHYGFSAPIFVDNSEAVTKLFDIDAQVIGLAVSAADKTLRVVQKVKEAV